MAYDPRCKELAETFLNDSALCSEAAIARLAQALQDTIDQTYDDLADEAKARDAARYDAHIDRQIDRFRDGDI